jgi:hypothetical protein
LRYNEALRVAAIGKFAEAQTGPASISASACKTVTPIRRRRAESPNPAPTARDRRARRVDDQATVARPDRLRNRPLQKWRDDQFRLEQRHRLLGHRIGNVELDAHLMAAPVNSQTGAG